MGQAIRVGAAGWVSTADAPDKVARAVRAVHAGRTWVGPTRTADGDNATDT